MAGCSRHDGADRRPGKDIASDNARRAPAATAPSAGTTASGSRERVARHSSIAAAVVEVAWAEGKLSALGVPTLTATAGWLRPLAAHHPLDQRRRRRARPPRRAPTSSPLAAALRHRQSAERRHRHPARACSPKCDIARATSDHRAAYPALTGRRPVRRLRHSRRRDRFRHAAVRHGLQAVLRAAPSPTSPCWTAPATPRGRPCASRLNLRASWTC